MLGRMVDDPDVPETSRDETRVFEALAEASDLYDRYLQLSALNTPLLPPAEAFARPSDYVPVGLVMRTS